MEVGSNFLNNVKMKMIGFKKEYDKELINSKYVYETNDENFSLLTKEERGVIVKYLEKS